MAISEKKLLSTIKRKLAWSIPLGFTCIIVATTLMVYDPILTITSYHMKVTSDENSAIQKFLSKPIESLLISTYLFNISNAQSFLSGEDEKLKVKEIGPFTYKETRYLEDLEIDLEAGVIRYKPRVELEFLPEKSVAHPDEVLVTVPNLSMLGATSTLSSYSSWTQAGFNILISQLNSKPIVKVNASTYIWGYDEPLVTLVHKLVPGFVNFEKLGILDRLYDRQTPNRLEVSARDDDKFMIKSRNGISKLPMGTGDPESCKFCDNYTNAYEGICYPSPTTPETPIRMFRNGLCKLLPMVFHEKVVLDQGVEGLVFNLSDQFFSLDPDDTENKMLDLHECFYGIPVVLTKVNFLGMDPKIYERIEGITPDPKKESYIIVEPKIGMQLYTYFPIQINLKLNDLSYNSKARQFSNMVVPVGYVEIFQPPLPKDTQHALYLIYTVGPTIVLTIIVVSILIGISLITYPIAIYYLHKNRNVNQKKPHEPLINDKSLR